MSTTDDIEAGSTNEKGKSPSPYKIAIVGLFVLAVAALAVASAALTKVLNLEKEVNKSDALQTNETTTVNGDNEEPTMTASSIAGSPRLYALKERGHLRCAVALTNGLASKTADGGLEGMDVDICHAIAAAAFGDPEKVEFKVVTFAERFSALTDDIADVVGVTTHTMDRDIHQASTKDGKSFTIPYFYEGLGWAGLPEFVECADNLDKFPKCDGTKVCLPIECTGLKICLPGGTTWIEWALTVFPEDAIVSTNTPADSFFAFSNGLCNVVGGERHDLAEAIIRLETGYTGPYTLGSKLFSKEPIAFITREDDPRWSDFVNSVVQALFHAEVTGITQQTAANFPPTQLYGDEFVDMYRNAIDAVGSYAEIYSRNMEASVPRDGLNLINSGSSGLIYSLPFGALSNEGPHADGTLKDIRQRGFVRCGVGPSNFSTFDQETLMWTGYDVDYCRAVAAAIFNGDSTRVIFSVYTSSNQFAALENGEVDVLSSATTHTIPRDVLEPTTGVGFSFSSPNYYGGMYFSGQPEFVDCADTQDVTSGDCTSLLICVDNTTLPPVRELFPENNIVMVAKAAVVDSFVEGSCNVMGSATVTSATVRGQNYTGEYAIGLNRYSNEPHALITSQKDARWSDFCFWVVQATYAAEEQGITKATGDAMPECRLFGPAYSNMLRNAIRAVGNFGEIYERHLGTTIPDPRAALNRLNIGGPQIYPIPGFE